MTATTHAVVDVDLAPAAAPADADARLAGLRPPRNLTPPRRSRLASVLLRMLLPTALFATWWIGTSQGFIDEATLSSPSAVLGALREVIDNGQLVDFLGASMGRFGRGLLIGSVIGTTLGVLSGLSVRGEQLIDGTAQMWRAIPFLALSPLFVSWFGIGETYKVVLIATGMAVPMYSYTYLGVRNVDRKLVEAARSFGCTGPALVRRVVLPLALPNVLMGLRICMAAGTLALIAAESVGADAGIGYLVLTAQQYFRQDYLVLCILLYAAIGLAFDFLIRIVERRLLPWRSHVAVR